MFGLRILLLLIGIGLVIAILVHLARGSGRLPKPTPAPVDKMVKCQHCGTYIPEKEAIISGDNIFCCEQHRREQQGED